MQLIRSEKLLDTMASEVLCSSGQWIQQDSNIVAPNVGRNLHIRNVSVQTGEEFSLEFLQGAVRRVHSVLDAGQSCEMRAGEEYNQNCTAADQDFSGVLGLRRMNSECASDTSEFVSANVSFKEIENEANVDRLSRHNVKEVNGGEVSKKAFGELNSDQAGIRPTAPLVNMAESPHSAKLNRPGVLHGSQSGKMKFICSFGGKILPRPSDGKIRYVGGEMRIISVRNDVSWEELVKKTSSLCTQPLMIKYQLPNEDLDPLISVSSDEDLQNMIEEYHGFERDECSQRPRIFLIPLGESENSSIEADTIYSSNPDYQYVAAVNDMVDPSSRKSNRRKSMSSEASQQGTEPLVFHKEIQSNFKALQGHCHSHITSKIVVSASAVGQNYGDFDGFSPEMPVHKERTFVSDMPFLQPEDLIFQLSGSICSHHGNSMPRAISDSKLQENGGKCAYHTQEGMNLSHPLNFTSAELSVLKSSASEFKRLVDNEVQDPKNCQLGNNAASHLVTSQATVENQVCALTGQSKMIVEMEASVYGLQIIRNADLEELRELGSGTYGTVFYGRWKGSDVAIKRIKKTCFAGRSLEQDQLTKDFWRETQILSDLHHPNVVAFYGIVPDGAGGTLATVAEYMVNGSLRHALLQEDRSLDWLKKLIIATDAAFGMEYLHSKNIVHFDLKCDNLLVNLRDAQRPICKVGDFRLSRIKRNTLLSGGVRGSLPWMIPELLNGSSSQVSEKVDVFSFGISMWEFLTGEEPYANMHCGAIIGNFILWYLFLALVSNGSPAYVMMEG
ncbi:uncharacterized protein LOC126784080 [Argentina anserina]|uniref:uncharacterized protein LOC126784080 n=1 Tax=Argentina anserina TaxID=57926 RepID=UPI0021767977|nr:uncharacterized protein LOC126784080 [Potentilla anserina]